MHIQEWSSFLVVDIRTYTCVLLIRAFSSVFLQAMVDMHAYMSTYIADILLHMHFLRIPALSSFPPMIVKVLPELVGPY